MRSFLVIGLGRFGSAVATELCALGNEVLAVDWDGALVQAVADKVTHAVTADARDPEVLRELAAGNFHCAIVAVGDDIGNSALITLGLKELGVERVVCKAQSHVHRKVLEKIGADKVVFPEHEMGTKLAHTLSDANVLNFVELTEEYGIVETPVPPKWVGKSVGELRIRNNYGVTLIAVRRGTRRELILNLDASFVLERGDVMVLLGPDADINRLQNL